MKNITRYFSLLAMISAICLLSTPAWSVNKEMVQLQASVDDLKAQMTQMSQSFNERMGVMKNLIDQNTDTMNKVGTAINNLQGLIQKQQGDSASHGDQLSGQIQSLNDSIDELKARLGKVSKQLEDYAIGAAEYRFPAGTTGAASSGASAGCALQQRVAGLQRGQERPGSAGI